MLEDSWAFNDLPMLSITDEDGSFSNSSGDEMEILSFSGKLQNYCVCCVDMVSSTKIAIELGAEKNRRYLEIFLKSMGKIIRNFDATIIKNTGDGYLFYFPRTAGLTTVDSIPAFEDALESLAVMQEARLVINNKLKEEGLPPVNYRISAEYGPLESAMTISSKVEDLFGSTINLCAKINSQAQSNEIVIGYVLYECVKGFDQYSFSEKGEYHIDGRSTHKMYSVSSKRERTSVNPFNCKGRTALL